MNQASGNATDSKGAVTGTVTGAPTYSVASLLGSGHGGSAVTLSGTAQYFTMGDVYDFNATANFSFVAWVKFTTLGATESVLGKTDVTLADGWRLLVAGSGAVTMSRIVASASVGATTTAHVATGIPYMLAGSYNGARSTVYIYGSGGLIEATAGSADVRSIADTVGNFRVGGSSVGTPTQLLPGTVQRISVYNTALSTSDLTRLYLAGSRVRRAARHGEER